MTYKYLQICIVLTFNAYVELTLLAAEACVLVYWIKIPTDLFINDFQRWGYDCTTYNVVQPSFYTFWV